MVKQFPRLRSLTIAPDLSGQMWSPCTEDLLDHEELAKLGGRSLVLC